MPIYFSSLAEPLNCRYCIIIIKKTIDVLNTNFTVILTAKILGDMTIKSWNIKQLVIKRNAAECLVVFLVHTVIGRWSLTVLWCTLLGHVNIVWVSGIVVCACCCFCRFCIYKNKYQINN